MIIKLISTDDTFVTNMSVKNKSGLDSNFGKSPTLDLFKLYNENIYSNSTLTLKINQELTLNSGDTLRLTDTELQNITLFFDDTIDYVEALQFDPVTESYVVGINNILQDQYSKVISDQINLLNNASLIKITSQYSLTEVYIKQLIPGIAGDTNIEINQINNVIESKTGRNKFERIEFSCILINLDVNTLLTKFAKNGAAGAFTLDEQGSLKDVNCKLVLKDVSTGIQKPSDYELSCYKLKKSFKEGIGSDVISFSDVGYANFIKLDEDSSWNVQGNITKNNLDENSDVDIDVIDRFYVAKGDEDITFDITDYIKDCIVNNDPGKGLLITFSDEFLTDEKTYFAKRLGSRHLNNKNLIPVLNVAINDNLFNQHTQKERYNITDEFFDFVLNSSNKKSLKDFAYPVGYDDIVFSINKGETVVFDKVVANSVEDLSGNIVTGSKSIKVLQEDNPFLLPEYFEESLSSNGSVNFTYYWHYTSNNELLDDILIKSSSFEVFYSEEASSSEENIHIMSYLDREVIANDEVYSLNTYFFDLSYRHMNSSKIPVKRKSDDVGNVFYRIRDKNSGNVLVDFDDDSLYNGTNLYKDVECYKAKIFIPRFFAQKNIIFEFLCKDSLGNAKTLVNNTNIIKVI